MKHSFRILILSSPVYLQNEAEHIAHILNMRADIIFHFRRKSCFVQNEDTIKQLSENFRERIVLHQNYEWAKKYTLKGIHLPQAEYIHYDRWNTEYPVISSSFHTLEEIQKSANTLEYVFLSPVFPSISKKNYMPAITHQEIQLFLKHYTQTPVIALGGCQPEYIPYVQDLGFQGIAFLGAVWEEGVFSFMKKLQNHL